MNIIIGKQTLSPTELVLFSRSYDGYKEVHKYVRRKLGPDVSLSPSIGVIDLLRFIIHDWEQVVLDLGKIATNMDTPDRKKALDTLVSIEMAGIRVYHMPPHEYLYKFGRKNTAMLTRLTPNEDVRNCLILAENVRMLREVYPFGDVEAFLFAVMNKKSASADALIPPDFSLREKMLELYRDHWLLIYSEKAVLYLFDHKTIRFVNIVPECVILRALSFAIDRSENQMRLCIERNFAKPKGYDGFVMFCARYNIGTKVFEHYLKTWGRYLSEGTEELSFRQAIESGSELFVKTYLKNKPGKLLPEYRDLALRCHGEGSSMVAIFDAEIKARSESRSRISRLRDAMRAKAELEDLQET